MSRSRELAGTRFVLGITSLALVAGTYFWRLSLLHTRTFDPDEFQHLHAAWAMHQGLLPYRDFFEHHMPVMQYGLSVVMNILGLMGSADDAIRMAFVARTIMWALAGGAVLLTMALGMELGGTAVFWMSGAFISTSLVFVGRTLEIRPDVPALLCWLASLLALVRALRPESPPNWRRAQFAFAGLGLGCALAFNQKLLLAGPGLAMLAVWYLTASERRWLETLVDLCIYAAATVLPVLALVAAFWWRGGLNDLLQGALLNNLGWPREVSPGHTINWMLLRDPLFSGIALAGVLDAAIELTHSPRKLVLAALVLPTISLFAGLAITPAPYPQYMLLMLPTGAVLGSRAIWRLLARLVQHTGLSVPDWVVIACAGAVSSVGLFVARPFFVHPAVYPVVGLLLVAAFVWCVRTGRRESAAALILAGCSVYSVQQLRWMQGLSNADALAEIRYVGTTTRPDEPVLDGFTGVAWFRPNADFHPFFHGGIRARLSPADVQHVVDLVGSCATRPHLVILDTNLQGVSPVLPGLVAGRYEPSPYPDIWIRRDPCVM